MEVTTGREAFVKAAEAARAEGRSVGLVPTMGALHGGHRSLVDAASVDGDFVALTIFVNPLQFGSADDLDRYPRVLEHDLEAAADAGVDLVFAPPVDEMYPHGPPEVSVDPGPLGRRLEGASRPGHFAGVATVVTKLFALCGRSRAYFGEKDYQQLAVVRRLVADLDLPVEIVGCPTVREPDGLALSSRNRRLSGPERAAAPVLHRALLAGAAAIADGAGDPGDVEATMAAVVAGEPLAQLDYAAAVDPASLERPAAVAGGVRLLVAASFGPVRLIDNVAAGR